MSIVLFFQYMTIDVLEKIGFAYQNANLQYVDVFFAVEAVSEWNDLSEKTRTAKSMYTFKKYIQDDLHSKYGELNVASGAQPNLHLHGPCRLDVHTPGSGLYASGNVNTSFEGPQPVF